jgi:hypothetical protein
VVGELSFVMNCGDWHCKIAHTPSGKSRGGQTWSVSSSSRHQLYYPYCWQLEHTHTYTRAGRNNYVVGCPFSINFDDNYFVEGRPINNGGHGHPVGGWRAPAHVVRRVGHRVTVGLRSLNPADP